jgi:hypothetical protein
MDHRRGPNILLWSHFTRPADVERHGYCLCGVFYEPKTNRAIVSLEYIDDVMKEEEEEAKRAAAERGEDMTNGIIARMNAGAICGPGLMFSSATCSKATSTARRHCWNGLHATPPLSRHSG